MLSLPDGVRIFVATQPHDMRKQAHGLAGVVEGCMALKPTSGDLFVFTGRNRQMLKLLFHDGQGYVLLTKKLDVGRFVWVNGEGTMVVDAAKLADVLSRVQKSQNRQNNPPTILP